MRRFANRSMGIQSTISNPWTTTLCTVGTPRHTCHLCIPMARQDTGVSSPVSARLDQDLSHSHNSHRSSQSESLLCRIHRLGPESLLVFSCCKNGEREISAALVRQLTSQEIYRAGGGNIREGSRNRRG